MKVFALIAVAICTLTAHAQDTTCKVPQDGYYSKLPQAHRDDYKDVLTERAANVRAADLALMYSPLSYACPPYSEWGGPKAPYWLSADVRPNFVFSSSFSRVSVHLTPRFIVRGLWDKPAENDYSSPVRTPSYMPGGTIFYRLRTDVSPLNDQHCTLLSLSAFHHSNGQDGATYDTIHDHINHYNGNFSTNYLEPAITLSTRRFDDNGECMGCPGDQRNYTDKFLRIGLEQHFFTADTMKGSYGDTRINITAGLVSVRTFCDIFRYDENEDHFTATSETYQRENWRVVANMTIIAGTRDLGLGGIDRRINAELLFHHHLFRASQTGVFFAVGYYGSDPYNIYYDQKYFYLRYGFSLGYFNATRVQPVNKRLIN